MNDAALMTLAVTTVAGLCFAIVLLLRVDRPEVLYKEVKPPAKSGHEAMGGGPLPPE